MSDKNVQRVEMPPGFPELWEGVTNARMEIAELKGMMKMHFSDGKHHTPPCATATGFRKCSIRQWALRFSRSYLQLAA